MGLETARMQVGLASVCGQKRSRRRGKLADAREKTGGGAPEGSGGAPRGSGVLPEGVRVLQVGVGAPGESESAPGRSVGAPGGSAGGGRTPRVSNPAQNSINDQPVDMVFCFLFFF